jgi:hypothetical protein
MKKAFLIILSSLFLSACTSPPPPTPLEQVKNIEVSQPAGTDIINLFWQLIDERRIPEAVDMMSSAAVPDDSARQAYGVFFNDIKSVNVMSIEPYGVDTWTVDSQMYKVTLEIYVSSDAAEAPIPYLSASVLTIPESGKFPKLVPDHDKI